MDTPSNLRTAQVQALFRDLALVWTEFSARLHQTPLLSKLREGAFTTQDYQRLLINHRQQVIEGGRWITRAASSIEGGDFAAVRSLFIGHAAREHKDYEMLEHAFVAVGGRLDDIQKAPKNIGTEAFHAFMFNQASRPDPFDLLGAMFIIEGLGERLAAQWGRDIQAQLGLDDEAVKFFLYHGEHDEDHMEDFERVLYDYPILDLPNMHGRIVKTAKVVARLYRLQIEELDNV